MPFFVRRHLFEISQQRGGKELARGSFVWAAEEEALGELAVRIEINVSGCERFLDPIKDIFGAQLKGRKLQILRKGTQSLGRRALSSG